MRDVTGMIGRILFAWARGSDLDNNAKRWRLIADVLNDLALMLDLLAPWFPRYVTFILNLTLIQRAKGYLRRNDFFPIHFFSLLPGPSAFENFQTCLSAFPIRGLEIIRVRVRVRVIRFLFHGLR